jgi:hypothetical protein
MMEQAQHSISVATRGPGFTDITAEVVAWLASVGAQDGLLTLFVRHTSASLTIQENADPDVLRLPHRAPRSPPRPRDRPALRRHAPASASVRHARDRAPIVSGTQGYAPKVDRGCHSATSRLATP